MGEVEGAGVDMSVSLSNCCSGIRPAWDAVFLRVVFFFKQKTAYEMIW